MNLTAINNIKSNLKKKMENDTSFQSAFLGYCINKIYENFINQIESDSLSIKSGLLHNFIELSYQINVKNKYRALTSNDLNYIKENVKSKLLEDLNLKNKEDITIYDQYIVDVNNFSDEIYEFIIHIIIDDFLNF